MTDLFQAKYDLIQTFKITTFFTDDSKKVEIKADILDARPIVTVELDQDDEPIITTSFTNVFTVDQLQAILNYAIAINPRTPHGFSVEDLFSGFPRSEIK